ncbi:MAG: 50S ribosomal protein L22 [Nanoarchaeota archaeon]
MATKNNKLNPGHFAVARALDIPVSTKHCIEICRALRYKNTAYAKRFLEEVADLKRAVPFKKFYKDTGHKAGMAAGRFPQKAAKELLALVKSVEANALVKGLNASDLKITKIIANKASIPLTGGRRRTATKRSHVEIEVKEGRKAKLEKQAKATEVAAAKKEVKTEVAKSEHKENKQPASPAVVEKKIVKESLSKPEVKEISSAELLRRAQEKAARLKKEEIERKSTEEVSQLYEELQKKGTLRQKGGKA